MSEPTINEHLMSIEINRVISSSLDIAARIAEHVAIEAESVWGSDAADYWDGYRDGARGVIASIRDLQAAYARGAL